MAALAEPDQQKMEDSTLGENRIVLLEALSKSGDVQEKCEVVQLLVKVGRFLY